MTTRHRILHLTDTHLFGDESRHYGRVDTVESLRRVLERAEQAGPVDLVALTGDLSEDGSAESYRRLRGLIEPWAERHGARTAYVPGNHDQRASFRAVLGEGLVRDGLGSSGGGGPDDASAGDPVFAVADLAGLRVVLLDTSVPGRGYGELGAGQLRRLTEVLAEPAEHGTLLLLHHPPVPARTTLLRALALQKPEALAAALRGGDVRAVLAGHYHHPMVSWWAGVPVIVSAAVANLAESLGDPAHEVASRGAGGSLVELGPDGEVQVLPFHVPLPDAGEEVLHLDPGEVAALATAAGPAGDRLTSFGERDVL